MATPFDSDSEVGMMTDKEKENEIEIEIYGFDGEIQDKNLEVHRKDGLG